MNRLEAAALARAAKAAKALPMPERFWSKVDVRGQNECWEWKACYRNKVPGFEYGAFWLNRRHQPASRVAWELTNGPMASGMFACHKCDNPGCCNPAHVFPGTNQENTADKVAKGRQVKGERVHTAKITEKDVLAIRAMRPPGKKAPTGLPGAIAEKYGITKQYVSEIWSKKSWGGV